MPSPPATAPRDGCSRPARARPGAVGEEWAGHTVTVFDPPRHLAVRAESDEFTNALEYRIEAAPGGAVLRYVHSGILTGDWDAQYDGASRHTDFYLHSLGEYLGHFAGRTVTYVGASGPDDALEPSAFAAVRAALGLGPDAAVGDRVAIDVAGAGRVDAEVDYLEDIFIGLRSDDALYRVLRARRHGHAGVRRTSPVRGGRRSRGGRGGVDGLAGAGDRGRPALDGASPEPRDPARGADRRPRPRAGVRQPRLPARCRRADPPRLRGAALDRLPARVPGLAARAQDAAGPVHRAVLPG